MSEIITKYKNGVIYTIECNDINLKYVYVGSTVDFHRREIRHKSDCNNINSKNYNYKIYQIIRENGGWNNFQARILENYPCDNKEELVLRERYWYESLEANMNSIYPQRKIELDYHKIYKQNNKENILLKRKKYIELNKENLSISSKLYYELNKEKKKTYYQNNKVKILEKANKEIYKCCCGKKCQINSKLHHEKSKFHLNFINNSILVT